MMSKIQNLNGTHNICSKFHKTRNVVYDVKDTKFEWNSQHFIRCCRISALFMMSKIQNLNGTHNSVSWVDNQKCVVYDVKDTKFEWNSQRSETLKQ